VNFGVNSRSELMTKEGGGSFDSAEQNQDGAGLSFLVGLLVGRLLVGFLSRLLAAFLGLAHAVLLSATNHITASHYKILKVKN